MEPTLDDAVVVLTQHAPGERAVGTWVVERRAAVVEPALERLFAVGQRDVAIELDRAGVQRERASRLDLPDRIELPAANQCGDDALRIAADRFTWTERQVDQRGDDETMAPLISLQIAERL